MDIRQTAFDAVVVKRQTLVIEPKEVQDGGIKIVEGMNILHGLAPKFVGDPVTDTRLHSGPGHPTSESVGIMIPPFCPFLKHRHAPKLSTPHHQGVIQHSPRFQILD